MHIKNLFQKTHHFFGPATSAVPRQFVFEMRFFIHQCFWKPRLVAVSKFKTEEDIIEAYEAGQRHFGENYVLRFYKTTSVIQITI